MFLSLPWTAKEDAGSDSSSNIASGLCENRHISSRPSVILEKGESEIDSESPMSSSGSYRFSSQSSLSLWGSSSVGETPEVSPHVFGRKTKSGFDMKREKKYLLRYRKEMNEQKEQIKSLWREQEERKREEGYGLFDRVSQSCSAAEVFLSNIPLTIGAVGLSWVTQGVVWFKFMEENIDSCTPVHFNSPACTFPEFPGCFDCDTANSVYRIVLTWHYFCHVVAGTCCFLFLLKVLLAWQLVVDELKNPATSTPMGVVCITAVCVFAGRGLIGEMIVLGASFFHFCLSIWFLHTAINVYRLWPDPGWFPNTVGISFAAIKTWLYFPWTGKVLMALCLAYFIGTFFISIYRVAKNDRIALPVCFIQLSAPSITMYALTILAQPSRRREGILEGDVDLMEYFQEVHQQWYLPLQHTMLVLSLLGMASILQALCVRWDNFVQKEFSPAHMALVFPVLSHTNAIQAYRNGVNAFSSIPTGSVFKVILFSYWLVCLLVGTAMCLVFTYHFVIRLPKWTGIYTDDSKELEPLPSPSDSSVMDLVYESDSHESIDLQFVSPAVLMANEQGALVRVRRGTEDYAVHGPFKRTRDVASVGFDPVFSKVEFEAERARLLDWVARRAPRRRHRTLSIPGAFRLSDEMTQLVHPIEEEEGVYGSLGEPETDKEPEVGASTHQRSNTLSEEA